ERRRHDSAPRPPGWHSGAMRIVVCVKYVPDLQSERSLDSDGHLVRGLDDAINELDENAVEAAVALAEVEQAEALALTVGPGAAPCRWGSTRGCTSAMNGWPGPTSSARPRCSLPRSGPSNAPGRSTSWSPAWPPWTG